MLEMIANTTGKNIFHLKNEKISYIIKVLEDGTLGHVYYGERIELYEGEENIQIHGDNSSLNPRVRGTNEPIMLNTRLQEYSSSFIGDFRKPAIDIVSSDGDDKFHFKYMGFETYKNGDFNQTDIYPKSRKEFCSETLKIILEDRNLELELYYTIFSDSTAIVRSSKVINKTMNSVKINKIMSSSLDFQDAMKKGISLKGDWSREMDINNIDFSQGTFEISTVCGASSAYNQPLLIFSKENFTENRGELYSNTLIYSGNFKIETDISSYDRTRVNIGINPDLSSFIIEPEDNFETPEAIIFYASEGLNSISKEHHHFIKKYIIDPNMKKHPKYITVNNWEASDFKLNSENLIELAEKAVEVGAELFVIDDGWFGKRNDDHSSLGDWFVDESKFKNGLGEVVDFVKSNGMKMGIWFEPEMVNEDSELYRNNPEWVLGARSKNLTLGRNQLILDFTNPKVIDYIYDCMEKIITKYEIDYIKWDMNRNMGEVNSLVQPIERNREVAHLYILGLYDLLKRLKKNFPDLIFEGCSSGGNRFDLGMLYYMPQNWVSDNTDAIRRIKIQYGASILFPLSTMDNAVSTNISYLKQQVSLDTRINVAIFGSFGYIYDFTKCSSEEIETIKKANEFYKENRDCILSGDFYRTTSPYEKDYCSWNVTSKDTESAIAGFYCLNVDLNKEAVYMKIQGLDAKTKYIDKKSEKVYYGSYLENIGIRIPHFEEHNERYFSIITLVEKYND